LLLPQRFDLRIESSNHCDHFRLKAEATGLTIVSRPVSDLYGSTLALPDIPRSRARIARCRSGAGAFDLSVDAGRNWREQEAKATMRVMVMVKATKASEAGEMPDEKMLTEMGKYNEELVKAGIMVAGEGLHPSSKGKRVRFSGAKRTVIDGPFAETKELIAGYWLWKVKSMDEAVEWLKRCPNPNNEESDVEIRPLFEADDFGEALTPELREHEQNLRDQLARQK
jgi:hypothetical protein